MLSTTMKLMKFTRLAAAIALISGGQAATAADSTEQRLERLEAVVAEMQSKSNAQETAAEKQAAGGAETEAEPMPDGEEGQATQAEEDAWYETIQVNGLIEVEASGSSPYAGDNESDIILATLELGVSARLNDWVRVASGLLYEEGETDLRVDIAYGTFANTEASPFFLTAGRIYLPFGVYETHMISDPLTLEIGEIREDTLQIGFVDAGFNGSLYAFNGDNRKDGENRITDWGAELGYTAESEAATWAVGIGYINDLGDTDALQDIIAENLGDQDVSKRVSGWTADVGVEFGAFSLFGEYLSAGSSFEATAVPWRSGGAKPVAWGLEAGYSFDLMGKDFTFAVGYQGTRRALALELPRERRLAVLAVAIFDKVGLSLEWAHDKDYAIRDGGTGGSADTATVQLAFEF